ncbi:hypothetical protein HMN09_00380100 [Mycena chlorophos]|uniref:DUF202 domain-containing protein n=1 Tax=Mycena chlorophos TaxID=658473 RepID=A0A8H6WND6_MYCCL|nr:hypothetical protein HMN09_00380100 [Mycena chlorophos]
MPGPATQSTPSSPPEATENTPLLPSESEENPRTVQNRARVSRMLENKGSVARDHLASERTFLAYVRTSLAIAAAGVALIQLFLVSDEQLGISPEEGRIMRNSAKPLAVGSIILALLVLALGTRRYFAVQAALIDGNFPVLRSTLGVLALVVGALIGSVYFVLLLQQPN